MDIVKKKVAKTHILMIRTDKEVVENAKKLKINISETLHRALSQIVETELNNREKENKKKKPNN